MGTDKKAAVDVYADVGSLILRVLLREPRMEWTSLELAELSGTSVAWANHVLNALEKKGVVERLRAGGKSVSRLVEPVKLLNDWLAHYNFSRNAVYPFYIRTKKERNILIKAFEKNSVQYAATGYYAAGIISNYMGGVPEMLYVYPGRGEKLTYDEFVTHLSNQYSLLPVQKGANLILVKPYYKRGVFFGVKYCGRTMVVSPIQLYLDIYHLDQGYELISELREYFHKEGLTYV